jgi:hypothetical protein
MNTIKIRELSIDQVRELSTDRLENLRENYRTAKKTDSPTYAAALRELELRRRGFDFDKSIALILAAARKGEFVSCKDLADASGLEWKNCFRQISRHLGDLDEYGHLRYGLLLSTIAVNKQHVATGKLEPGFLKGFVGWAKDLGYSVGDPEIFLRAQQARVFAWAQEAQAQAV